MKTNTIFPSNCKDFFDVEKKLENGWTMIFKLLDGREYEIDECEDEDGYYYQACSPSYADSFETAGEALNFVLGHGEVAEVRFK